MVKDPKSCKAFLDGSCLLSRGKALGGTSTINDFLYIRGTHEDYNRNDFEFWNGNISYRIFNHIEYLLGEHKCTICNYGGSGMIHIEFANFSDVPKKILVDAYQSTGYRRVPRRASIGFLECPLTIKDGERFNMAKAFLVPIKNRANLFLTKKTEVQTIVISEPTDKRATGVNVSVAGVSFFIRAKKEVILTAGPINNAKLLLLSGIGSKTYLQSQKITTQLDIPAVGQNLQFHLTVPVFIGIEPTCESSNYYYNEIDFIKDTAEYILSKNGNLSHINIRDFVAYINPFKQGVSYPNQAINHMYFKIGDRNLMAWLDGMNYHPKIVNALLNYNRNKSLIVFLITLLYPHSRGEILLNETHHMSNPVIKGNFLSDENNNDYLTLLSGFTYVTNLTNYMSNNRAEVVNLDLPDCRNFKFCSQSYVKCYIHNMAYPNGDVIGTAKMGPECDKTAVVKETLEVRTMRCLRIADSSVLNNMPVGGNVATDAMVGFRLGEILKEKWLKNYISPFHEVQ